MRKIAITGASGGIGAALAEAYARRFGNSVTLHLTGRRSDALAHVKATCEALGAKAVVFSFDMRDRAARTAWLETLAADDVDTLVLGAGVSASVEAFPADAERPVGYVPENAADLERELTVNGLLPALTANELVRLSVFREAEERKGTERLRIAFIASLAALTGLPGSPGYSASKAMVRTYAQALRRLGDDAAGRLRPRLSVTVLFPGFVESAMSARYAGTQPGRISAREAACRMLSAIEAGKAEYAFPRHLAWGIRLLNLLPESWQKSFLRPFFFTVEPDRESLQRRHEEASNGGEAEKR